MGHSPDLKAIIKSGSDNEKALNDAIKQTEDLLNNSIQNGIDYINKYTSGIVTDPDKKLKGLIVTNGNSYTKFSDSYSLDALSPIIDGAVKFATDYLTPGVEGPDAAKLAADTGQIVKGILSLFASSSTTNKEVNQIFTQFRKGESNFAIYYASNSGTIAAQNAWGNKELIVVTNVYIFAQVNPDLAVTQAEARQHILDNLKQAEEIFSDKEVESITNPNLGNVLINAQKAVDSLKQQYMSDAKRQ